ncbi:T6SS effector amidase Tae4 family protein [uncultured Alistipes sp.]|uniref:T6SS effector amidase Tae4 family protein n=1 Tax=Alistipes ihumii TaxID=1470347 RepID=UPI002598321E|nr:T6SS effector amidase Tae4 family protein [uncultured Alistipes sp.]
MKKYIVLLALLLAGTFTSHAQQLVSVTPGSITVPQQGGTYTLKVDYAPSPDSLFDWRMTRYTAPYSDIQVSDNGNLTARVTFPANTGYTPRSGSVTLYYPDPYSGSQLWGSCSFSQQGLTPDYSIRIAPTAVYPPAEGGYSNLQVSYNHRTEAVNTTFLGADGLPAGYRLTAGANGALSLYSGPNKTGSVIAGTVTVRYSNPLDANSPETASFTVSQQPIPSWISLSPKELSVSGTGGSYYCTVAYCDPDTLFNIDYRSYSGGASQLNSVGASGPNQIKFDFKKNLTQSTITGQITVYVTDPINSSRQLSDVVSFSQPPAPYEIRLAQSSFNIPSGGGTQNIQMSYVHRDGPVALPIHSISGLPDGCSLSTSANGVLVLTCNANTANATRTSSVTVNFNNPLDANAPIPVSFSFTQLSNNYAVSLPQSSIAPAPGGGSTTLAVDYLYRTDPVSLSIHRTEGLPDGCTLTHDGSGILTATFTPNFSTEVRSGTATVYFNNPVNAAQPISATFSYSQNPASFNVDVSQTPFTIAPEGGTVTIPFSYADRPEEVTLEYLGAENLPEEYILSQSGDKSSLTLQAKPNRTGATRYHAITVRFANPLDASQPVTATFSVSQETMSSWIVMTPQTVEASGSGETRYFDLSYSVDSMFTFQYLGCSGDQGQVVSARILRENRLAVEFAKNLNDVTITRNITFTFQDPANASGTLSDIVTLIQQPAPYDIRFQQDEIELASGGGTQTLGLVYTVRPGPVTLNYKSAAGLPEGWSITPGANGQLTLAYGSNGLTSLGSGNITVYYENPLDGNNPVSATLAYTQQPDNYAVSFSTSQASVPAGGGNAEIGLAYTYRTDAFALSYDHAENLPAWCTISQQGTKLNLQVSDSNDGTQSRSATVTLHFTNQTDASKPVSATLTVEQPPLDFSLSASPQYVTIAPEGGSQSVMLSYQNREGSVTLDYLGTSGLPEGCSASFANSALSVTATPNYRGPDRYAEVTASFTDPLGGSPVTVSFSVSQPTYTGYWIEIPTERFTVDAGGGSYEYDFAFGPTDSIQTMPTPRLGEPVHPQVDKANFRPATKNGQKGVIAFKSNTTGQTINGTVVLEYPDPTDHSKMLTHAISFTQASALPVAQQQSTTERIYTDETGTAYNSTVTYYDGLYRPEQTVQVGASPAGGDIVSFVEYDCMGRTDSVSYLPFVTTTASGTKVSDPLSEQMAFYSAKFGTGQGDYARSYKTYDDSPLGFVLNQTSPGEYRSFSGYYTHFGYRLNTQADAIRHYRMEGDSSLKFDGYYAAEQLTVKRVLAAKDNATEAEQAQRQESYEYTNAQGQVIAKEVRVSETDRRMTYYVYDDLGQQRYVLPPAQHEALTDGTTYTPSQLHKLSYYTEYDDKGQAVRQWNPGTDCVYSLYDRRGRLAMTQSGKQRTANEWSFTKYDRMDRPVLSGIVTGGTYESHKAALDAATVLYEVRGTTVHGYTNQSYPSVAAEGDYLSVTYYDDYDWLPENDPHAFSTTDALGGTPNYRVQGQSTGSKSKVLGIETDRWLTAAVYFDSDYQTIQSVTDLYPSGIEITSNTHDFTGNVTRTKVKQTVDNTVYEYDKWFEFDSFGRLQQVSQQITGDQLNGKVVLASYTYDELGQTATKAIHNGLETESYAYDMTGRTNAVTSPSFSYALDYEQSAVAGAVPRLDGNVSAMRWGSAASTDKAYAYAYDRVGQLRSADYKLLSGGVWSPSANYQEGGLTYDLNGNILSVQRTDGNGENLHELTYTYDGYRLLSVGVNGTVSDSYRYDADGNMTFDGRRGLTIAYNTLNLPEEIVAGNQKISYIYSASGEKLACDANGSLTYYRSVMVYGSDNKLLYMLTPEGTVSRTEGSAGTSYTYNYFKTDHLGSTRVMLSAVDGTLQASQTTDFYPFGLAFEYSNLNKNKYLFSGKELQDGNLGGSMLEWYDFGARFYDPVLGRWFNVDPAAQVANPYLFCGNSPMMYIDQDGRLFWMIPAIAIGAAIGAASYTLSVALSPGGFDNWNWGGFFQSIGIGAVSGAVTSGIGQIFGTAGNFLNEVGRGLAHGVAQGGLSELQGGNFLTGLVSGGLSSWAGSAFQLTKIGQSKVGLLAFSGLSGGLGAELSGGDFWKGLINGLTISGLNHLAAAATKPTFEELLANFPTDQDGNELPADQVYKIIGGDVEAEFNRDPVAYRNACALRVSRALNKSGVKIPKLTGQTLKGGDGNNYFFRAADLYKWMSRAFGKPFSTTHFANLAGKQGIYIMRASYPRDFGAWGHATLFNKTTTIGHSYAGPYAADYNLWPFK